MAIKKCKECGKDISTSAKICPHCGKKYPTGGMTRPVKLVLILLGLIVIGKMFSGTESTKTPSNDTTKTPAVTEPTKDIPKSEPISQAQQEPRKTDLEILAEIETKLKGYEKHVKDYYPDEDMLRTLNADSSALFVLEVGYAKPDNETQKKTLAKAKTLRSKVDILRREVYAETVERAMLEKRINAEVEAKGTNKSTLQYKYALMSKATAYKMLEEGVIFETAKNLGFTKIIFTDGFRGTWTVDIPK